MTGHSDDVRTDLGAYALGALEPTEQHRVEQHLAQCPSCLEELAELESVVPVLARLSPEDLSSPVPSDDLFARITDAVDANDRTSRWRRGGLTRRRMLAVAASVVVVAGGATAIGVASSTSSPSRPAATVASGSANGVRLRVTATSADAGTRLQLRVSGLPRGERCHLVALAADGSTHEAGRWDADYGGEARVQERTDVPRDQLRRLTLYGRDGQRLVAVNV